MCSIETDLLEKWGWSIEAEGEYGACNGFLKEQGCIGSIRPGGCLFGRPLPLGRGCDGRQQDSIAQRAIGCDRIEGVAGNQVQLMTSGI